MIFHSALFVNSVFPTATVLVVVKTSSSEFTLLVLSRILSANVSNTYLVLEFWKLINSSFFFAQLFPNLFDPLFLFSLALLIPCLSRVAVVALHLLLVGVRRMMKMIGSLPTVAHRWLIPCASLNHAAEVFTDKSMTIWLSEKAR